MIGGLSLSDQKRELLAQPPNVVVATLGRLEEAIAKSLITLENLKLLVVDEADRFRLTRPQ
jgi:superfamily II DNA/RNA helicase